MSQREPSPRATFPEAEEYQNQGRQGEKLHGLGIVECASAAVSWKTGGEHLPKQDPDPIEQNGHEHKPRT